MPNIHLLLNAVFAPWGHTSIEIDTQVSDVFALFKTIKVPDAVNERKDALREREELLKEMEQLTQRNCTTGQELKLTGHMYAWQGHDSLSYVEQATNYCLANGAFRQALRRNPELIKPCKPETRWAIPAITALVKRQLDQWRELNAPPSLREPFVDKMFRALGRCTFAPGDVIRCLQDEGFEEACREFPRIEDVRQRMLEHMRLVETSGTDVDFQEEAEQHAASDGDISELIRKFEYNAVTGAGPQSCTEGNWRGELEFGSAELVQRIATGTRCERVRAVAILGFRDTADATVVTALRSASNHTNLVVRAIALASRVRLAPRSPEQRALDGTLHGDLLHSLRSDRSYWIRAAAAEWLIQLPVQAEEILPVLRELLGAEGKAADRAKPVFLKALLHYDRFDADTLAAVSGYEPFGDLSQLMILARHCKDEATAADARRRLKIHQRTEFEPHERQSAMDAFVDTVADRDEVIRVLVERMYLDLSVAVRDHARGRLVGLDRGLALQLGADSDRS